MNDIAGIIIKPVEGIKRIAEKEPLFRGIIIFVLAVIVFNRGLIGGLVLEPGMGLINIAGMLLLWLGLLLLANFVIVGVQKLIDSKNSSVSDARKFKKLTITQFYISTFFILRPLLDMIFSSKVVIVILTAWVIILLIVAVKHIWEVTEIKSALSVIAAILIIFLAVRVSKSFVDYSETESITVSGQKAFLKCRDI